MYTNAYGYANYGAYVMCDDAAQAFKDMADSALTTRHERCTYMTQHNITADCGAALDLGHPIMCCCEEHSSDNIWVTGTIFCFSPSLALLCS